MASQTPLCLPQCYFCNGQGWHSQLRPQLACAGHLVLSWWEATFSLLPPLDTEAKQRWWLSQCHPTVPDSAHVFQVCSWHSALCLPGAQLIMNSLNKLLEPQTFSQMSGKHLARWCINLVRSFMPDILPLWERSHLLCCSSSFPFITKGTTTGCHNACPLLWKRCCHVSCPT